MIFLYYGLKRIANKIVIWPEKVSFEIGENESFIFRKDDELVFSKWVEDPDYREEIVLRNSDGEIIKTIQGDNMK